MIIAKSTLHVYSSQLHLRGDRTDQRLLARAFSWLLRRAYPILFSRALIEIILGFSPLRFEGWCLTFCSLLFLAHD